MGTETGRGMGTEGWGMRTEGWDMEIGVGHGN